MASRPPRKSDKPRRQSDDDLRARKEKVLHTRVPSSLDRQLKERARNLGLSVSTVVRHVLLNTFGLVEDIVVDSANLAMSIAGDDSPAKGDGRRAKDFAMTGVLGWQEAVLNVNGVCERCNTLLAKGRKGVIAVRESPGPRTLLCARCLNELAGSPDDAAPSRKKSPNKTWTQQRKRPAPRRLK
jgi:hypothetical protein